MLRAGRVADVPWGGRRPPPHHSRCVRSPISAGSPQPAAEVDALYRHVAQPVGFALHRRAGARRVARCWRHPAFEGDPPWTSGGRRRLPMRLLAQRPPRSECGSRGGEGTERRDRVEPRSASYGRLHPASPGGRGCSLGGCRHSLGIGARRGGRSRSIFP